VLGKSIISPPRPRARKPARVPGPPTRALALGLVAVIGSGYALLRHYLMSPPPVVAPSMREIPAPDLTPTER